MKTTPEKLESALQRGLAPAYLISGDEPLTAGEAADALRATARAQGYGEREVFFIERANSNGPWDEIHAAAQALSLFASKRIIEVRIPGGKPGQGAKVLQELVALAGSDFLLLVITGALDWETQKAAWVQAINNAGVWVVAEDVPVERFPAWLRARATRAGIQLDDSAVAALVAHTEGNLLAAEQELHKLALSGVRKAGAVEVLASVTQSSRFDVTQLGEAVLQGDRPRALRVLAGLRAEGEEPTLVLWSLWQELRMVWLTLVPGAQAGGIWSRNRTLLPAAAARFKPLGRAWFAQLNAHVARTDQVIKGQHHGNAWDELALLVAEFAGGSQVLGAAA
ncbi:MAG: DNA polymerase III subunit delta [Pseudomonadota bacterium]